MASIFGTSSTTGGTSTTALDPQIKQAFLNNVASGNQVASGLGVQQFAPRTGDYNAGSALMRQTALAGPGMANINAGAAMTGGNAMTRSTDNIGAYMNPFTQNVADTTLAELDRARQMTMLGNNANAVKAGAFGGDRQALTDAETNRNFFTTAGNTLANLYNTGYNTAVTNSQSDLSRNLTASNQLANLGLSQQTAGYQAAQQLQNQGQNDQQYQQQILDATRNLPLEQQAIRNQSLGVSPAGGSGSTSTSQNNGRSGLFK